MLKIIAIVLVGLSSSVVFADTDSKPEKGDKIEYKCKFEGERKDCDCPRPEKIECWVEGRICKERHDLNGISSGCRDSEDPIEIKCSNGFKLESRDAATQIDNRTLWINADDYKKIATIRVEDIIGDRSDSDERRKADLVISKDGKADRLEGSCKFEKDGHGHDGN